MVVTVDSEAAVVSFFSDSLAAFCILEDSINCIRRMYPKVEILVPDVLPEMLNLVSRNYFHNNIKYFQPGFHDNLTTSY